MNNIQMSLFSENDMKQNRKIMAKYVCNEKTAWGDGTLHTLIKWPGGKSREIKYIEGIIPRFNRYIEPFFGSGAAYFHIQPQKAVINDISPALTTFYTLVKHQNAQLRELLYSIDTLFSSVLDLCDINIFEIENAYVQVKEHAMSTDELTMWLHGFIRKKIHLPEKLLATLIVDRCNFENTLLKMAKDKILRTLVNDNKLAYTGKDLRENLVTGFASGVYMYFRDVYNDISLRHNLIVTEQYSTALFYFIREYCYGSMFRYNAKGEFNIPYGGMSYNRKDFKSKIDSIFNDRISNLLNGAEIYCSDFEELLSNIAPNTSDFIFLDPPYDTEFSDYEGRSFDQHDQARLAKVLKDTQAKYIMIIKNTEYIYSLYKDFANIKYFDKTYTYNVRSRNNRSAEHLIVTNLCI